MKKLLNVLLVLAMVLSLVGCTKKETAEEAVTETTEETVTEIAGGYTLADSPVITDDIKALVEKASGWLLGATYTPVAYVASQVVSGTNHLILCKETMSDADATNKYVLVTIYEDLSGNAEIIDVKETDTFVTGEDLLGGYIEADSPVVTDEANAALEKAVDGLTGCAYKAVALVATQVVSGTNYCLLCELTPVVPNAESHYSLVYVYADLNGNGEISDVQDFEVTECDDGSALVYFSSLDELNNELGSRFFVPEGGTVEDEKFFVYYDIFGGKIGEYDYKLDGQAYNVRFSSDFTRTDVVNVVVNDGQVLDDANAAEFKDFYVTTAGVLYVAHWLTTDGQYAMTTDTFGFSEADFKEIAETYHEGTVAQNH